MALASSTRRLTVARARDGAASSSRGRPFYVTFDALVPELYRALRRKSIQPREKKVYRAKRQKLIRGVRCNNERARYERRELAAQTHRVRDLVIEQHAGHA